MLTNLIVKNFATIEDIDVSFDEGMNVLIGETGAGKSILIAALGQLMGNRSEFGKIRNGESKAYIKGEFYLTNNQLIKSINNQFDDLIEDHVLTITKNLDINGKAMVKINNHLFSLSDLKKIMSHILDIHSQHLDDSYINEDKQLMVLDKYLLNNKKYSGILNKELDIFNRKYCLYSEIVKKINDIKSIDTSNDNIELLEYSFNELDNAHIQENEIEDLEEKLHNYSSLANLSEKMNLFEEQYSKASNLLYEAKKSLGKINDSKFEELINRYNEDYYDLEDVHEEISKCFEGYQNIALEIENTKSRLYYLNSLKRKYGNSTREIIEKYNEIKNKLDEISNAQYLLNKLNTQLDESIEDLNKEAEVLNDIRKKGSIELSLAINKEIKDLKLDNADFMIDFVKNEHINENGNYHIRFLLKANLGGKYLPLKETASLGETSRINLALKTVFNLLNPVETIVFDEIDTGISGVVATMVAKKIHQISNYSQSLVITHLPQVAASGDFLYNVKKETKNNKTYTLISLVDDKKNEIAKMLSGINVNENSLKAASDLIEELKK